MMPMKTPYHHFTQMKLFALYVLAVCAAAGYAQDTIVSTTTSYDPSSISSVSSSAASSLNSLYSSLSSYQSSVISSKSSEYVSKTSAIGSSVSSVASAASSAAKTQLNPTQSQASAEMAGISGGGVFMGIIAGLLAAIV